MDLSRLESEDSSESLPCLCLLTASRLECFLRRSMSCLRSIKSPLCFLPLACQRETKENSDVARLWVNTKRSPAVWTDRTCDGRTEMVAERSFNDTSDSFMYDESEHRTIRKGHTYSPMSPSHLTAVLQAHCGLTVINRTLCFQRITFTITLQHIKSPTDTQHYRECAV